jgi:voltage-gated potassium channel
VAGEVRRTGFREIRDILHASSPAHVHLRSRLTFVLGATLLVDAVASALILLFERHAHGTEITNIGDSVFWTTTQLLTVSSQLPNPISAPARVLDVFLQAYAISVVAVLAGSWGAFFHRRSMERAPMGASDHPAS